MQMIIISISIECGSNEMSSNRAKWFNIHSWVGVQLSILLCFVLITGTLATVSHEIDWLTNKSMRVAPSSVADMNWQEIYQNARELAPNHQLMGMSRPIDRWFAAEVTVRDENKEIYRKFFHPSTGEYLGNGRWYNWQRFFRMTHRHLMLPVKYGVSIVSISALLMLISLITSLIVYRHWWKGFFRWPRTQHRKVFWGDVHRLLGVWNIWFVLIISVTGLWYFAEILGVRGAYPERGQVITESAKENLIMPSPALFGTMMRSIDDEFSELTVNVVRFPARKNSPLIAQGQASAFLVRDRANAIFFDPASGHILSHYRGEQLNSVTRLAEAADPLHFGTFAGFTSKIIYFIFGVLLCVLAVSGTYIYAMKISRISYKKPFARLTVWRKAISSMGAGKWFSYIVIVICSVIAFSVFTGLYDLY
jgi:uncharacterized iron-regulated membrane protein